MKQYAFKIVFKIKRKNVMVNYKLPTKYFALFKMGGNIFLFLRVLLTRSLIFI